MQPGRKPHLLGPHYSCADPSPGGWRSGYSTLTGVSQESIRRTDMWSHGGCVCVRGLTHKQIPHPNLHSLCPRLSRSPLPRRSTPGEGPQLCKHSVSLQSQDCTLHPLAQAACESNFISACHSPRREVEVYSGEQLVGERVFSQCRLTLHVMERPAQEHARGQHVLCNVLQLDGY
jgi:hypothetical protein